MNEEELNKKLDQQEDEGWDKAVNDFAADKGVKADNDSADKSKEKTSGDDKKPEDQEQETEEQRVEREKKEADEAATKSQQEAQDSARERAREIRESRNYQRDILAEETAMRDDVRTAIFKDKDYTIRDGQGNEINSIEDVMQYTDPSTGQLFTQDAAGAVFLKWTQEKQEERQADEKRVNSIADVALNVKDEVDAVLDKYREYLNRPENASLKQRLSSNYMSSLQIENGVIVGAPMSAMKYYDDALEDRFSRHQNESQAQQERRESEAAEKKAAEAQEKAKKLEAENKKLKARGDRADVYDKGGDKNDDQSDEDKGWDKAINEFKRDKGVK